VTTLRGRSIQCVRVPVQYGAVLLHTGGRQAARTASEGAALTADAASIVFFSARVSIELSTSLLTEVRVYV
jgi:uncharacterized protein (AIM24 family)